MRPIDRPNDLKSYYQDKDVVDVYMERRTAQPLNGLLHRRQVDFLNEELSSRQARRILEIACGPGRLTAEVVAGDRGVAVDASQPMLETAQRRTGKSTDRWSFLRTDAFVLPFRDESFDAVYTLRFIRHFQEEDRHRLYREIQRVLRPGGIFLLDALNKNTSMPSRLERGLDHYKIYDVLYQPGEVEQELCAAGFKVHRVEGMLRHFPIQRRFNRLRFRLGGLARIAINTLERLPGNQPSTWMVVCEKPS